MEQMSASVRGLVGEATTSWDHMSASFRGLLGDIASWVLDVDYHRPEKPRFRKERILHVLCIGNELGAMAAGFGRVAQLQYYRRASCL